ncbi:hypothetical protein GOV13_00385 [Candidatus Pacearchaeota archaeon]|nr:hypothetical protein [Candidatus Pacearchaeota archaeon]
MKINKRGMSDIVTTIIIIGIALAVVGIVWYVINNVVEQQSEDVQNASELVFKSCVDAGYERMNETLTTCSETIKYVGGFKCCTTTPTA